MKIPVFIFLVLVAAACSKEKPSSDAPYSGSSIFVPTFNVKNNGVLFSTDNLTYGSSNSEKAIFAHRTSNEVYVVYANVDSVHAGTYTFINGECNCSLDIFYQLGSTDYSAWNGQVAVTQHDTANNWLTLSFSMTVKDESSPSTLSLTQGSLNCIYP